MAVSMLYGGFQLLAVSMTLVHPFYRYGSIPPSHRHFTFNPTERRTSMTTAAEQYLRDKITGADKEREQAAVAHLLSLNGTKMPKETSTDPLTREMMKGLTNGR